MLDTQVKSDVCPPHNHDENQAEHHYREHAPDRTVDLVGYWCACLVQPGEAGSKGEGESTIVGDTEEYTV